MKTRRVPLSLLLGTLVALLMGSASAQDVTYTFENGSLSGPETLSLNGFRHILFVNASDEEVDMSFLRLREGTTLEEIVAADEAVNDAFSTGGDAGKAIGEFLSLADLVGGVHLSPQSRASAYVKLEPGRYGVGATSGGSPGETSASANLEVTVGEGEVAGAPAADFSLHMGDFHFVFPETMSAGEQLWEIGVVGQPHMALIFKLNEGATAADVLAFMSAPEAGGPPPFEFGTLIPAISSGQTFYASVDLSPGSYVAICPLPDLGGEGSHADHGMVDAFTVQ